MRWNKLLLVTLTPQQQAAEVKRRTLENYSTSAMWFELIISAYTFAWHRCRKKRRGRPRRCWTDDIRQWTGIHVAECVQHATEANTLTEASGEPWCPCQQPPILSHEDGHRQSKQAIISVSKTLAVVQ